MSKYGNRKITTTDGTFDSLKEARRWQELKLMQKAGEIKNLERQKKFLLIPKVKGKDGYSQRATYYIADFVYLEKYGDWQYRMIVEDTKGVRTEVYKLKKKLMYWRHGIRIREV